MYVFDPFQSVAAGTGTPSGWSGPSFGTGLVEAFGTRTAGGGAFTPHQWFRFSGNNLESPSFTPVSNITVWFAFRGEGYSNVGKVISTISPLTPSGTAETVIMQIEDDQTISFYTGPKSASTLIANTGSTGFVFNPNVWYFFQVNITLSLVNVSGTSFLQATVDLAVDGTLVITNQTKRSNFYINHNFPADTPLISNVDWFQPNNSGLFGLAEPYIGPSVGAGVVAYPGNLWTITMTNPGSGYTTATATPSAGTATLAVTLSAGGVANILPTSPGFLGNAYISAPGIVIGGDGVNAAAIAALSPSPFRRIPQAVVEVGELPTTAKIRIPQIVIEVATLSGSPIPPIVVAPPIQAGGGARNPTYPNFCIIPPPGRPKYKGCGRKPDWCLIPEREWVAQPSGAVVLNRQGAILLPDPADGAVVVFRCTVPVGYDGMLLGQYNTLTKPFAEGSGDIVWRIRVAGRYLRDRGNMQVSQGTPRKLASIAGGLQLRSGNLVEFLVEAPNTNGSLPAPGDAYVVVGLHGYFYPRK